MNNSVALIEGVFDVVLPNVPTSLHRWGRVVWLQDLHIGLNGQLLFVEDGRFKSMKLSRISNVIEVANGLEIHTQSSIYKLRFLK